MNSKHSDSTPDETIREKTGELKEACDQCGGHHELDTSQGDFTTIAVGILLALAVYAIIPAVSGIRLGDYPTVIVYGGFLVLVVLFWFIAEKIKEHRSSRH